MASSLAHLPLHHLPRNAQLRVVESMEMIDIISYYLCSQSCKSLVVSLNMHAESIRLFFCERADIDVTLPNDQILSLSFYVNEGDEPPRHFGRGPHRSRRRSLIELDTPKVLDIKYGDYDLDIDDGTISNNDNRRAGVWDIKAGWSFRKWFENSLELFHHPQLDYINFSLDSDIFDIDSIKLAITGADDAFITVHEECEAQHHRDVYQTLAPMKCLTMGKMPYKCDGLLMQNFEKLEFSDSDMDQTSGWTNFWQPTASTCMSLIR